MRIMRAIGMFNSVLVLIFGVAILESGLSGIFVDYTRWLDGATLVIFGAIGFVYGAIKLVQSTKRNKSLDKKLA